MKRLSGIREDLAYLCSADAQGRLSGTEGAKKAAQFLAESLKNAGYAPMGENGYFTPVSVPAARLASAARLIIGNTLLKHRVDFAEWNPFSSGGSVRGKLVTILDDQDIAPEKLQGNIVLISQRPEGFDIQGTIRSAIDYGVAALLIEYGEPRRWFHKTVFGSESSKIPVLRIRRSVAEKLAGEKDLYVHLELPLEISHLPCNNVLGLLKGTIEGRTLALTAHYDHLGDDPEGPRFPGTIDNASGVAAVLETVRWLANQPSLPPFNILAAFLTGEESGLHGARHLAANPPLPITAVINVDSLGFEEELFAMRTGHKQPGLWLADIAADTIVKHGIEVRWIAGGEDSAAFTEKGVPSIGLGQKPLLQSSVNIHTVDDNLDNIHEKPVIQGITVLNDIVKKLSTMKTWN